MLIFLKIDIKLNENLKVYIYCTNPLKKFGKNERPPSKTVTQPYYLQNTSFISICNYIGLSQKEDKKIGYNSNNNKALKALCPASSLGGL